MSGTRLSLTAPERPGGAAGNPMGPIQSRIEDFTTALALFDVDLEAEMAGVVEELLSLDPEERFTRSRERVKSELDTPLRDASVIETVLPAPSEERLVKTLKTVLAKSRTETADTVWYSRDPRVAVTLLAGYDTADRALELADRVDDADRERLLSAVLAYFVRLWASAEGDGLTETQEALLTADTGRLIYYTQEVDPDETIPSVENPKTTDDARIRRFVTDLGATVAYRSLEISVSRGAELAGRSPDEFDAVLRRFGVDPRYGPESVEELYGDGV